MEETDKNKYKQPYKVVVIGAESTGKSWICKRLSEHFDTSYCVEFLRDFADEKYKKGLELQYNDNFDIANGQQNLIEHAQARANKLFFCDTDIFQTYIYSLYYYGQCQDKILESLQNNSVDLYLFLENDIDWQADPLRDGLKTRDEIRNLILDQLNLLNLNYEIVHGLGENRLLNAIKLVKNHFIL